jgi:hypothetical protein
MRRSQPTIWVADPAVASGLGGVRRFGPKSRKKNPQQPVASGALGRQLQGARRVRDSADQREKIVRSDVRPEPTRVLLAGHDGGEILDQGIAQLQGSVERGNRTSDDLLEQRIAHQQDEVPFEDGVEARRLGCVEQRIQLRESIPDEGFLQRLDGREVPVDGGDAHIRLAGDRIESERLAALESGSSRLEDACAIARCIPPLTFHAFSLTETESVSDRIQYPFKLRRKAPPMTDSLRPVAIVTGASSGIGREFAYRYAREGFDLVLVARSSDVLQELADELFARFGAKAVVHVADLSTAVDVDALAEAISHMPRVDHLVYSAGLAPEGDLTGSDARELRRMIDINVT